MKSEKYLTRAEAAAYLVEYWGGPAAVTPKTLAKMAVVGGGPAFCRFARRVAYKPEWLDSWAHSRQSPILSSTSDADSFEPVPAP